MRPLCTALGVAALCATSAAANAANVYADNSTATWLGFMNVFELDGVTPVFSSSWGVSDLVTTFDDGASTMTLSPNTIGDPDPFWYQGGGGPGAPGNKVMEANTYQQIDDGSLSGTTVNFSGNILSHTFTSAHVATIFIRDFAPDYSSFNESSMTVSGAGAFSLDLLTDPGAGRHVQWGFQVKGVNVWVTDTAPFGNMVVATPTPGALALFGVAGLAATRRRRA